MRGPFNLHGVSPKVLDSFQWNVVLTLFTNNNRENVVSENGTIQIE